MNIIPNKNSEYNFEYILIDFISNLEVDNYNLNYYALDELGKFAIGLRIKIDESYYEIVDYQVGKGGWQSHKYSLGFGVNKVKEIMEE